MFRLNFLGLTPTPLILPAVTHKKKLLPYPLGLNSAGFHSHNRRLSVSRIADAGQELVFTRLRSIITIQ